MDQRGGFSGPPFPFWNAISTVKEIELEGDYTLDELRSKVEIPVSRNTFTETP